MGWTQPAAKPPPAYCSPTWDGGENWKGTSKKYSWVKTKTVQQVKKKKPSSDAKAISLHLPPVDWFIACYMRETPTWKNPPGDTLAVLLGPDRTEPRAEYQAAWCLQDGGDSGLSHQQNCKHWWKFHA